MRKLTGTKGIWILKPQKEDLVEGARYALISLPWTFNRMMLNTGSKGQQARAINIAKGIVSQEILKRALIEQGIRARTQRKSHRDEDLFDFRVEIDGSLTRLDVKTWNYFTDYISLGREPLSPNLIIKNADYPGPEWVHFFPMLVPHTQIAQDKEAFCFAISSSIDSRKDALANRQFNILAAFPSGEVFPFMSYQRLCTEREKAKKGIFLRVSWSTSGLFDPERINIKIIGEWNEKELIIPLTVKKGKDLTAGPFSVVSAFQIETSDFHEWKDGNVIISIHRNEFKVPVLNSNRVNINVEPRKTLILTREDFCNLVVPNDYTLYVLGWMIKSDYLSSCREYPAWIWPKDSVDKYKNQPWSQITEKDLVSITRAGFEDCIRKKPSMFCAGWMKTHGRGGGACCYVYPNIGMNGGVKETNLYVLPKDLQTIDSLG